MSVYICPSLVVWALSAPIGRCPPPSGIARLVSLAGVFIGRVRPCAPLCSRVSRGVPRPARTQEVGPPPLPPSSPRSLRSRPLGFGRWAPSGRAVAPSGAGGCLPARCLSPAASRPRPLAPFFSSLRSVLRLPAARRFPLVALALSMLAPAGAPRCDRPKLELRPVYLVSFNPCNQGLRPRTPKRPLAVAQACPSLSLWGLLPPLCCPRLAVRRH